MIHLETREPRQAAARPARRDAVPSISAVVPAFNEQVALGQLLPALRDRLRALTDRHEIVVVNDGSRDGTREVVLAAAADCGVNYLELSRNFGKEAAIGAGLAAARGEVVVLLDADGQHPLDLIAPMLERWRAGRDMVYAVRRDRRSEPLVKRVGARLLYRLLSSGGRVQVPPDAGDFRLMDRRVVDTLNRLQERARFNKGLYAWVGFDSAAVEYDVAPRAGGRSSFTLRRLFDLALDGITSFTTFPLRLVAAFGFLTSLAAVLYGLWSILEWLLYGARTPGFATLIVCITFFSGVQLISIGLIGAYLARVFEEVKQRPLYVLASSVDRSRLPAAGQAEAPADAGPAPAGLAGPGGPGLGSVGR